jgi:hypothetical protein
MKYPDTCPMCGSGIHLKAHEDHRRFYWCGSWIRKDTGEFVGGGIMCEDRTAIREAAAIIREMVDEWGNAMDAPLLAKAEEWLKDNEP